MTPLTVILRAIARCAGLVTVRRRVVHRGERRTVSVHVLTIVRLSHRVKARARPEEVHLLHRLNETTLERKIEIRMMKIRHRHGPQRNQVGIIGHAREAFSIRIRRDILDFQFLLRSRRDNGAPIVLMSDVERRDLRTTRRNELKSRTRLRELRGRKRIGSIAGI